MNTIRYSILTACGEQVHAEYTASEPRSIDVLDMLRNLALEKARQHEKTCSKCLVIELHNARLEQRE